MDESDDSIAVAVIHFEDGSSPRDTQRDRGYAPVHRCTALHRGVLNGSFQADREESTEEYELAETSPYRRGRSMTRYRLLPLTNEAVSARGPRISRPSSSLESLSNIMYGISSGSGASRV